MERARQEGRRLMGKILRIDFEANAKEHYGEFEH